MSVYKAPKAMYKIVEKHWRHYVCKEKKWWSLCSLNQMVDSYISKRQRQFGFKQYGGHKLFTIVQVVMAFLCRGQPSLEKIDFSPIQTKLFW